MSDHDLEVPPPVEPDGIDGGFESLDALTPEEQRGVDILMGRRSAPVPAPDGDQEESQADSDEWLAECERVIADGEPPMPEMDGFAEWAASPAFDEWFAREGQPSGRFADMNERDHGVAIRDLERRLSCGRRPPRVGDESGVWGGFRSYDAVPPADHDAVRQP